MKILGIETSCDETAVCIVEAEGDLNSPSFRILGDALYSQVKIHEQYGGVFPALAKREHAKNLVPLLEKALGEAGQLVPSLALPLIRGGLGEDIKKILEREAGLFEALETFLKKYDKPNIDAISVTAGPGLEPALWVGVTFAEALGKVWDIKVIPSNHMEGHILSPLLGKEGLGVVFPALALLISGGHTELVKMNDWMGYELIGQTRDDAVGEAFDKASRILGLPYPGGPQISKLAAEAREKNISSPFTLPRPMIKSPDFDFSFSGIKTSVLYSVQKLPELTEEIKMGIAREFEDAVTEVLVTKTKKALEETGAQTLILGGGVVANSYIRNAFAELVKEYPHIKLLVPEVKLSTDNAVMIAMAGYFNHLSGKQLPALKAQGNLGLNS